MYVYFAFILVRQQQYFLCEEFEIVKYNWLFFSLRIVHSKKKQSSEIPRSYVAREFQFVRYTFELWF